MARNNQNTAKSVETLTHDEARRKNIPTAEHQAILDETTQIPIRGAYERHNRDLDPQLVWRGKDQQDASNLVVNAAPLYFQEKVHPKALINDLARESKEREHDNGETTPDLFADSNGLPKGADRTEFYQFDANYQSAATCARSTSVAPTHVRSE
jgi:adenine-specific DNA-methyltransferase